MTRSGWKDIAVRVYLEFNKDRVLAVAAGVTFYTLLSLFPAIAALVTCYGLFADVTVINDHLAQLHAVLPTGAVELIGDQVKRIAAKGSGSLSITFFSSLLLSIWSANAAMKAMFDALNVVYEEEEKRNFFWLNLRSLTFTVGALLFIIIALNAIVVVPVVLNFLGLGSTAWLLAALRWPAILIVLLGGLSVLYRFGPSREHARWRWVGVGSVVAGLLWLVGVAAVLLVRRQFRHLQRDLRLARRGDRLHDLDLDLLDDRPARRRDQRRAGAPDRPRHHHGPAAAHGRPPGADGRHRRRGRLSAVFGPAPAAQ